MQHEFEWHEIKGVDTPGLTNEASDSWLPLNPCKPKTVEKCRGIVMSKELKLTKVIASDILDAISARRGIGDELEQMDDETYMEFEADIEAILSQWGVGGE